MLRTCALAYAVAIALASLASSSDVRADGMPGSLKDGSAAPTEHYGWDGFYVGGGVGAGRLDYDADVNVTKKTDIKKTTKHCKPTKVYDHTEHFCDPPKCHDVCWDKIVFGGKNNSKMCKKEKVCKKVYDKPNCTDKKIYRDICEPQPDDVVDEPGAPETKNRHFSGDEWDVFGTVQVGYDRLVRERFLIGAFADFDFYSGSSSSFSGSVGNLGMVDGSIGIDHVWSVGGRLGYLVDPRLLLYGVGGYTQASLDGSMNVKFIGKSSNLLLSMPDTLDGYFVGGGGEFKLHKNLSLKVEYRWADYGSVSASAADEPITTGPAPCTAKYGGTCTMTTTTSHSANANFDVGIQTLRADLVWKFGEPEPSVAALK